MKNLNRKFRKALSIASLGALGCVQSVNINAASDDFEAILNWSQAERQQVFQGAGRIGTMIFGNLGIYRLLNPKNTVDGKASFVSIKINVRNTNHGVSIIVLKDFETQNVYVLPFSTELVALLELSYSSFPSEWNPSVSPGNERKCWEKTDEFIKCFKENYTGKKDSQDKKDSKNKKDEYGLTPLQKGLLGLAIAGVAGVGGVWAISKIINSVGEAGGKIIHGNNPKIVIKH